MAWYFVLPAMVVLGALIVYPLAEVLRLSLGEIVGKDQYAFVGLQNYYHLVNAPAVGTAFWNSVVFTVCSVGMHLLLGLAVALLLNQNVPGRSVFRVISVVPWMFSAVVVALTWQWMLDPQFGIINVALKSLGVVRQPIPWLSLPNVAMPAVIMANVWRGFPFATVMILAGLQGVPRELYEAAQVDGVSSWGSFRYITLPSLRYIMSVMIILDTIWNFKHFDLVQVMTNGGPADRTEVLVTMAYKAAFEAFQFGYGAAIAVVIFLILLIFTMLYIRTTLVVGGGD